MGSESFKAFKDRVGTAGGGKKAFAADELAPIGTWLATITVALSRETKAGDHRLRVKFTVDSGPHAGTCAWWGKNYEPANEDNLKWFFGFTETMGIDWDLPGLPDAADDAKGVVDFVAAQLAGKRAQIKCGLGRPYKDKAAEVEVKFVNAVPAGSPDPIEKPKAATVQATPKAAADAMSKMAAGPKKSASTPPPPPGASPRDSL